MKKIVITAALCGAGTTKEQTPYVPITPEEIAADAVACVKAGASVIHIHIRDKEGKNTMETDRWIEVVTKVREALAAENLDAVLNLTSSGSKFPEEMRLAHLPILKPEMCSYDPGTMNWANSYVFLNTPSFLEKLGELTIKEEIKPELEIFDGGMIGNVEYYLKKGFLKEPLHYQLVLNVSGGMKGNIENINYIVSKLRPGSTWSISGKLRKSAGSFNQLRIGSQNALFHIDIVFQSDTQSGASCRNSAKHTRHVTCADAGDGPR